LVRTTHGLLIRSVGGFLLSIRQDRLPPYAFKLVGKVFDRGPNPRVDAQFSAAYCVANALVRRTSKPQHFAPAQVFDPALREMIERVRFVAEPAMNARGHAAMDLDITTSDGLTLKRALDFPPGFPGADLDDAQHLARFQDCLGYAPTRMATAQVDRLLDQLQGIARLDPVRSLVPALVVQ
jgi:2-methylcitrate dehydratase PrpD